MKKIIVLGVFVFCMLSINGCIDPSTIGIIMDGTKLACEAVSKTDIDLIEEQTVGVNLVQLHITTYKGMPGYLFTAFDSNQELGKVFYYAGDKKGMKRYKSYKKMGQADKKQFIREDFLAIGINLETETIPTKTPTRPEVDAVTEPISPVPASYTAECNAEKQICFDMGRKPDDFWYCKDKQDRLVPTTKIIAYFNNDGTTLVIGIDLGQNKVVQRKEYPMAGYRIYRNQTAFEGDTPRANSKTQD